MRAHLLVIVISLCAIYAVQATPQRNTGLGTNSQNEDPTIQITIDNVFNASTQRPTTQSSRGAGFVVTPDPNYVPTSTPQTRTINQQKCTCVPYHLCDPSANTVGDTPNENENELTGFGKINVQFDPLDCVDLLDVCCISAAIRNESLVPKSVQNTTNPAAGQEPRLTGCGLRNVGGIDFELAGAVVSSCIRLISFHFGKYEKNRTFCIEPYLHQCPQAHRTFKEKRIQLSYFLDI